MKTMKTLFLAAPLMAASIGTGLPAQAAIRCNGGYQINSQGEFESPYCEEKLLAQLSGVPVEAIRRSWSTEQNACRVVGNDIRIMEFCHTIIPRNNHRCTIPPCF